MAIHPALIGAISPGPFDFPLAAYFFGGAVAAGSGTKVNTIQRFAFADDSRSTLGATLSNTLNGVAASANSAVAGYAAGGSNGAGGDSYRSTVDKVTFADDTKSTLGTGLDQTLSWGTAYADSGTAWFYVGGFED